MTLRVMFRSRSLSLPESFRSLSRVCPRVRSSSILADLSGPCCLQASVVQATPAWNAGPLAIMHCQSNSKFARNATEARHVLDVILRMLQLSRSSSQLSRNCFAAASQPPRATHDFPQHYRKYHAQLRTATRSFAFHAPCLEHYGVDAYSLGCAKPLQLLGVRGLPVWPWGLLGN
jgi:hypothetical protein